MIYAQNRNMYEPLELKLQQPEDAVPLSMSPTKVRTFMAQVNIALASEHRLPSRSPEVVNAILANAIDEAQQSGDVAAEYDAWAIVDDLTYRTITDTNNEREAAGLERVSHFYRQQLIYTAERYAKSVHDYEAVDSGNQFDIKEQTALQNQDIQDRVLGLIEAGAVSRGKGFGLMLLLEAAQPTKDAETSVIEGLKSSAAKDIYVRIFNQHVRTPDVATLEVLVQFGDPGHTYSAPKELVDRFMTMYPSAKYETTETAYIRLRESMIKGIEELYPRP